MSDEIVEANKMVAASMPRVGDIVEILSQWCESSPVLARDHAARAVMALFAPILAEKERERCGPECYADSVDPNCLLEGEFQRETASLLARALAAEAALAGEREKVARVLEPFDDALGEDDEGYSDALTVVMKWGACTDYSVTLADFRDVRKLAAAIRAD